MKISSEDTVLDIGCAEGTITRKIAKKASSVTGIDKSELMLEELNKKAKEENITNIKTIQMDINDLTRESLGDYDIVLASRCLNGIYNIKDTLLTLDEIANKYVYITVFGSSTHEYKKEKENPTWKWYFAALSVLLLLAVIGFLTHSVKKGRKVKEARDNLSSRLAEASAQYKVRIWTYHVAQQQCVWHNEISGWCRHPRTNCSKNRWNNIRRC